MTVLRTHFAIDPHVFRRESERRADEAARRAIHARIDSTLAAQAFDEIAARDLIGRDTFAIAANYLVRIIKPASYYLIAFIYSPPATEFAPNRAAQFFNLAPHTHQKIAEILSADDLRALAAKNGKPREAAQCALAACGLGPPWSAASRRVRATMLLRAVVLALRRAA
jgi:hypothetical protein